MISAKRSSSTIITAGNAATPRHADPSKQTTSPISPSARKRKWTPTINVENTKHSVVLRAGEGIGLAATTSPTDWTIQWQDGVVTVDQLLHMRPWQRINHFPAMHHLCHKDYLARNLTKMRNEFPHEYAFWPRTWCMRTDAVAFTAFAGARARARAARGRPPRWYIAKPDSKSRGIGIYLFSDPAEFQTNPEYEMVVQQYIERPLLIEGYKFDMRVYALITQCDPLRLFVYKEGLARFATEPYGSGPALDNQAQICMHLTNYSVNKRSTKFVDGGADGGSKRTLTWALEYLDSLGHDGTGAIWTSIKDIIAKSILTVQPELARVFRTCTPNGDGSLCFELLGFDVILDHKLRPFVLEINHSPSLSCETAVDHTLKQGLLENIFGLLNPTSLNPRKWMRRDRKQAKQRLYAGSNTTAAGASPLAATSLAPKPVAAPTVVDNDPDADSADEADDSPAPPLLPLNPSPAPPAATDDCSPSDPLDAATAYETAHLGLFERVYPPSDPATAERYATYLTTAQSLFVVAETAATRARKEAPARTLAPERGEIAADPTSRAPSTGSAAAGDIVDECE
ncbi:Tubulin polyglutamylase ttll13P [Allomyces arbusculus]|nr:Tubulin polyglutamylase ttll13P [Allomyces arbusculus]